VGNDRGDDLSNCSTVVTIIEKRSI